MIDLLAFGAHPDDVEIGMAGTILKATEAGLNVVICDLTLAELSSNGDVETRQREAARASTLLNLHDRLNLRLPDRGLRLTDDMIRQVVAVIRRYKPRIVYAPYRIDRHPDHGHCAALVEEAVFSARIRKFDDGVGGAAHKVERVAYYMINALEQPDYVVDVSDYVAAKRAVLGAYESQFMLAEGSVATPLTDDYIEAVIARDQLFGKQVELSYGEGFKVNRPLVLPY